MVLNLIPTPDELDFLTSDFAKYVYKEISSSIEIPPSTEKHWEGWVSNKIGKQHEEIVATKLNNLAEKYEVMMTKEYIKYRRRLILCWFGSSILYLVGIIITIFVLRFY